MAWFERHISSEIGVNAYPVRLAPESCPPVPFRRDDKIVDTVPGTTSTNAHSSSDPNRAYFLHTRLLGDKGRPCV